MPGAHLNFFEALERAQQAYVADTSTLQGELEELKEAVHRYQRQVTTLERELASSNTRFSELERQLAKEVAEKHALLTSRKSLAKRFTALRKGATELENFRKTIVNMVQVSPDSYVSPADIEASFAADSFAMRLAGGGNVDRFAKDDLDTISELPNGDSPRRRSSIPRELLEPTESPLSPNPYSFHNMTVLSNDNGVQNGATTARHAGGRFETLESQLASLNYNLGTGTSTNNHTDVLDVMNDRENSPHPPRHTTHQQRRHLDRPSSRAASSALHNGRLVSPNKQLRIPKTDDDSIGRRSQGDSTDASRKSCAGRSDDLRSVSNAAAGPAPKKPQTAERWNAQDEDVDMADMPWLDEEREMKGAPNHRSSTPDRDWMRDTTLPRTENKPTRKSSTLKPLLSPQTGYGGQRQLGKATSQNGTPHRGAGGVLSDRRQQSRPASEKSQATAGEPTAVGDFHSSSDIDAGLLYKKIRQELSAKEFNEFARAIAAFNASVKTADQTVSDVDRLVKDRSLFMQMKALIYKATEESGNS